MTKLAVSPADGIIAILAGMLLMSVTSYRVPPKRHGRLIQRISSWAEFSFTLYAIHVPVFLFAASALGLNIDRRLQPNPLNWVFLLVIIGAVTTLAWAFSLATERHTDAVRRHLEGWVLSIKLSRLKTSNSDQKQL